MYSSAFKKMIRYDFLCKYAFLGVKLTWNFNVEIVLEPRKNLTGNPLANK